MKKYARAGVVALGSLLFLVATVIPAHAASLTQEQVSSIISLLQSFNVDTATIAQVTADLGVAPSPSSPPSCLGLSSYLTTGSTGSSVTQLQNYLISQGYLSAGNDTGFYGNLTAEAVGQLQMKLGVLSSSNEAGYGNLGPKTEAAIFCVPNSPSQPAPISTTSAPTLSGVTGPVSLTAGQTGTWTVNASVANTPGAQLSYSVNWDDTGTLTSLLAVPTVQSSATFTHAYNSAGKYVPTFTVSNSAGSAHVNESVVVEAATPTPILPIITNSGPVISTISTNSGPTGTKITVKGANFSTSTTLHFDGYTYLQGGGNLSTPNSSGTEMTFTVPSQLDSCSIDQANAPVQTGDYGTDCAGTLSNLKPGTYPIFLTQGYYTDTSLKSSSVSFTVTAPANNAPVLSALSPSAGAIGSSITVKGANFSTSTTLHFDGYTYLQGGGNLSTPNSSGTEMTFTVPSQLDSCSIDQANAPVQTGDYGTDCAGTLSNLKPGTYPIFLTQGYYTDTSLKSSSLNLGVAAN